VLDAQGGGFSGDVIAAIDFATNNKVALGIDVMNLSLGHPIYESAATDPLVQAVERAVRAGIVVVASAGNIGMNPATGVVGFAGVTSPGNAPSALTVGSARTKATATRTDDEVSMFSSRGPTWFDGQIKPDVLAPGQALFATMTATAKLSQNPANLGPVAGYTRLSGTSMAAGVASGVVALMIEANRQDEGAASVLTPNTIKALLQYTAIPLTHLVPETAALEQGAGSINAAGAVAMARAIDPAAALGTPWLEVGVETFTTIGGETLTWGKQIVWGTQVLAGDAALWNLEGFGDAIIWGNGDVGGQTMDHIVWGDSANLVMQALSLWGDHIVWGDSFSDHIVWGDSDHIVWGDSDHIVWGDSDHIVWGDSINQLLSVLGL
jgi:subtilisin family serine protease